LLVAAADAAGAQSPHRLRCAGEPSAAAAAGPLGDAGRPHGNACADLLDAGHQRMLRMRAWHADYLRSTRAVRVAYAPVLAYLRGNGTSNDPAPACRLLAEEAAQVLVDAERLRSPDERLGYPLTRAFASLRDVGLACGRHQDGVARVEADHVEGYLSRAAEVLAGYGLRP
jgi:hypothetical protein